jgi:RNA polymerase sigma-70 factor (ECF subfamily)
VERDLVEGARRGDRASYEALVRLKVDAVHRTAQAILGNAHDADDVVQDAFVAAWRQLPRLRDVDRFDAWLGRIVLNASRMALRRRGRIREIRVVDAQRSPATGGSIDPGSTIIESLAFDRAFERLSVDDRYVLVLHHLDDLPVETIARQLGVPVGTVKSRLHRARGALSRALAREDAS